VSDTDLVLSKVAVTRFSHDLAGVMSAVSNSLDLLAEFGGADEETLSLAANSAEVLLARLRFFRAAFGSDGPLTDAGVTEQLFADWLKSVENRAAHFDCEWHVDNELPLFWFRVILLAGQIVAESMIRGGKITVVAKAGERRVSITGTADAFKADSAPIDVLNGASAVPTPKTAGAAFIRAVMTEQKLGFDAKRTDTSFSLSFTAR